MKTQYYDDSRPESPYFYGIFLQKHCNKSGGFQALFLVLNGTAVNPDETIARRHSSTAGAVNHEFTVAAACKLPGNIFLVLY